MRSLLGILCLLLSVETWAQFGQAGTDPKLRLGMPPTREDIKRLRSGGDIYQKWDPDFEKDKKAAEKAKKAAEADANIPPDLKADPAPPKPDYFESVKSMEGIDSDNDGVRDDVEVWINENADTPDLRRALKLYTKARMDSILESDLKIAVKHLDKSIKLSKCFTFLKRDQIEGRKLQRQISGVIINNKDRSLADDVVATEYRKIPHGAFYDQFETWHKFCPFEPERRADFEANIEWKRQQKEKQKKK